MTERGAVLLNGARRLLTAVSTLRHDVQELGSSSILLGATATSARSILADFLAKWIPEHPEMHVAAVEDSELHLMTRLGSGDCDAAIVAGPIDSAIMDSLRITTVHVIALFPPDHAIAASGSTVNVSDLAAQPLLLNGAAFPATAMLMREFASLDVTANIVYESSAGQTLAAMTEAGMGVAVFGDAADLRGFDLVARQLLDNRGKEMTYDLYIAWLRNSSLPWLKEFAIELSTSFRNIGQAPFNCTAELRR